MSTNIDEKMITTNGGRAATLMLLTSMVLFLTLHDTLPLTTMTPLAYEKNASITVEKPSAGFLDNTKSPSQTRTVTKQHLPIYLLVPDSKSTFQTTWGAIATGWNRTAQYTDLIELGKPVASLPDIGVNKRPVVMIHCGPKSGSTTLRVACRKNLEKTCDIKVKNRLPMGYMNEAELYPLIQSCSNTTHFCTKETVMPMDVPTFDDTTFIHMFPFRTYDEWAASALKQAYDRGGENECNRANKLVDKCQPSRMEIDFRKYGKTDLSKFKELAVPRMNERNEAHIFILYFHRDLDKVLTLLSDVYNIPRLPGSDGHGKSKRPEGTCDESILQKFHDCFSSQLMNLN